MTKEKRLPFVSGMMNDVFDYVSANLTRTTVETLSLKTKPYKIRATFSNY